MPGKGKPLQDRVRVLVRPRSAERVPGAPEPKKAAKPGTKPAAKKPAPKVEQKAGKRYVSSAAGVAHFHQPMGTEITGEYHEPRIRDAPAGALSHVFSLEEMEHDYGPQRWSMDFADGWTARIFTPDDGDPTGVLTAQFLPDMDAHTVIYDGFTDDDDDFRDLLGSLDAAIDGAEAWAGMDADERQAHRDEHSVTIERRSNEEPEEDLVEYWETNKADLYFGYLGYDTDDLVEVGFIDDQTGEPDTDTSQRLEFTIEEATELRTAIDDMWSNIDERFETEEEEEEDPEGVDTAYDPASETLHIENHDDGSGVLEFNVEEAHALVALMAEFEPMETPPFGSTHHRKVGRWDVEMDEDGSINFYREDNNTGTSLTYDDWLMSIQSFDHILKHNGWELPKGLQGTVNQARKVGTGW